MMMVSLLLTALVIAIFGKVLVRMLGWPTGRAAAGRWLMALLLTGVVLAGLPDLLRAFGPPVKALPTVSLLDVVPCLTALGLAALGYVGWTRGASEREHRAGDAERTRHVERRRALPPPPVQGPPGVAGDDTFAPVQPPDET